MDIDDILADIDADTIPIETRDLQTLTRLWVAERIAPELLAWPTALIERVLDRMTRQVELIEDETAAMEPSRGFPLIVLQTEMERMKFLVRSYMRARLSKIDAHPLYYSSGVPATRLSLEENQYLNAHQALLSSHYSASFLGQFPQQLQKLDDTAGGISMVETPDADGAVFIRALRDIGYMWVPVRDERIEIKRGEIYVLRWSSVKNFIEMGDVELI